MTAIIGLVLFAAALYWLYLSKARDVARCAAILGLVVMRRGPQQRGLSSEGFDIHESVVMTGTLEGRRTEVAERIARWRVGARALRNRGSQFTVLSFVDPPPGPSFRLQPVGVLGLVEAVSQDLPPAVPTGDPEFDAAFRLSADDAGGALRVFHAEQRRALLDFRDSVAGPLPSTSTAARLASGLLLGTFERRGDRLSYAAFGTPSTAVGQHLVKAAAILARLT